MRVLVVATREPWPLNSGSACRLFYFIEELARRAEVTLALPGTAQYETEMPGGVRVVAISSSDGALSARDSTAPQTTWVGRLARRHFGFNAAVDAWLRNHARRENYDVAFFSGATLGVHVPSARVPVVWDGVDELVLYTLRDVQYGSWRRWPAALQRALLYALYERDTARQVAATTFTSSVDAACARRWSNGARVEVVSNGVNARYFHPSATPPVPGTVVFVGSLEFPPNVDGIRQFAARVWPRIRARRAGGRLMVVGRRPVSSVKALESVPGVEVFSDVPDVRPFLAQASAVVVPTRQGGGVKNKILEACAVRRPVVASPRALAGLSARVGVEVLVADQPRAWVERVCRLLDRPAYAGRIARAGHEWVLREHRWSKLGDRLMGILGSARQSSRGGKNGDIRPGSSARLRVPGPASQARDLLNTAAGESGCR